MEMSDYRISPIETPEEGRKTNAVARGVFGSGVALLLPRRPNWGFYAHKDEDLVGGVLLEKMAPGEGLLSWIFVDAEVQGHRLGSRLLETGIRAMDEAGLKTQFALVRADNTASWSMFAKNGYTRPSVFRSLFGYSMKGFGKRFGYSLATGYSTWVRDDSLEHVSVHPRGWAVLRSLLFSLFIGAALSLFSVRGVEFFYVGTAMVAGITALRMLVAYPVARLSGPVRFDAPQGGTPLSVLLALAFGAWWPTFGFFVPKADIWRDRDYARYNALQAFATWMSLILVYVAMSRLYPALFAGGLAAILDLVIIYQLIPVFPFDAMDGARVARHSRILYAIGLVVSVLAIVLF
jgi:GNAT superfamily N-acetyltransferase